MTDIKLAQTLLKRASKKSPRDDYKMEVNASDVRQLAGMVLALINQDEKT